LQASTYSVKDSHSHNPRQTRVKLALLRIAHRKLRDQIERRCELRDIARKNN
jgi:hypothetical protein